MKTLIAVICLVSTVAWAENPPPLPPGSRRMVTRMEASNENQGEVLPENYQVTLAVTDKDKIFTEISLVAATTNFLITTGAPRINFSGTLTPDDKDGVLVRYGLGISVPVYEGNSVQYLDNSAQASVRVHLGEPVTILKSGTQTFKLTVSRLTGEAQKRK